MVHPIFGVIAASFSLVITKDKDASSNYPVKIEALSVASPISRLSSAKTVDKFSAVFSASTKSFL
jgi:hypothetical protein